MNYLLHGDEPYLLQTALKKYIAALNEDIKDAVVFDGFDKNFDVVQVIDEANTFSLFSDHKVIIVENPAFLTSQQTLDDRQYALLEEYLTTPYSNTTIFFILQAVPLDSRKKATKMVQKRCRVEKFVKLDERAMQQMIVNDLKQQQVVIEKPALNELLLRIPNDIMLWKNELNKLTLFGDTITPEVLNHLISTNIHEDIFQLADAVVKGDSRRAFKVLQDVKALNQDAIAIILILASQFRFMLQAVSLYQAGYQEKDIASILSAHPYRVSQNVKNRHYLQVEQILQWLNDLANLDQQIKAGNLDKDLALELFLIKAIERIKA